MMANCNFKVIFLIILYIPMAVNAESFSEWLWDNSTDLAYDALSTDFIQGIKNGNLSPRHYGGYMVQDVTYLAKQRDNFKIVAEKSNEELKEFFQQKQETYDEYTKWMLKIWRPDHEYHVRIGEALQEYFNHCDNVAEQMDSIYYVVAMTPCERLWGWLADEIKNESVPNNVYQFWIDENKDGDGAADIAAILDKYAANIDWDQARTIFRRSMQGEVNFFSSATEENDEIIEDSTDPPPVECKREENESENKASDMIEMTVGTAVGAVIGFLLLGVVITLFSVCCYHHCVIQKQEKYVPGSKKDYVNNAYNVS